MLAVGLVGWILLRADMRGRGWVIIVAAAIFVLVGTILPLVVPFPVALTGLIVLVTPSSRWRSGVTVTTDPLTPLRDLADRRSSHQDPLDDAALPIRKPHLPTSNR